MSKISEVYLLIIEWRKLAKLHAEFTNSRACRSQDNALVEGKNGAVIGKLIDYGCIAGEHAEAIIGPAALPR